MIAADDDRRFDASLAHELVDAEPEPRALAVAEPQDPRGQSLEGHALLREVNPAHQRVVVSEHLERGLVGHADVVRIAGERGPAERSLAFAEEGPDVFGHEAGDIERVRDAGQLRLRADVVAVVEDDAAALFEREHRAHVLGHRRHRPRDVGVRIAFAQPLRVVERQAVGHVAVQRVVRRRLIGQDVGRDAARDQRRQHVGGVAAQADRARDPIARPAADAIERLVEAVGGFVEIPRGEPALDPLRIDFDDERRGAVHRRGERLGAAHAAESGGHHQPAGQRAAKMPARHGRQRLVRALHDALAADIDPAAGGHLSVHREPAVLEIPEILPGGPRGHEQRVGDEHARRAGMRLEHADRLAGLDEQRFVVLEVRERADDRVVRLPVARRLARSAVDDEIVGTLGHFRIEIVHQHPQRGFLRPAFAGQRCASRRANGTGGGGHLRIDGERLDLKKRRERCQFENEKFFT